jgi:hypothetical protein
MKKFILVFVILTFPYILFAGNLGNGYKEAKWGMSIKEIKKNLHYPIQFDYGDSISFSLGENKYFQCEFYNNKLYKVVYGPLLKSRNDLNILISALKKKYGQGKSLDSMQNVWGNTCLSGEPDFYSGIVWVDEITKISLAISKSSYDCTVVIYEDVKILKEKQLKKERESQKENDKKRKQIDSDI